MEWRCWPKLLILCVILSVNFLSFSQEPFNFKSDSIACDTFPPPRNFDNITYDDMIKIWWEIPYLDTTQNITPLNLTSYIIMKDGENFDTIQNVGEDTVYFWDDLGVGYPQDHEYFVCALYDLTICGLPGEFGQSECEGPVLGYGYGCFILNFTEDWSTGSFDPNLWTASEFWSVQGPYGHPPPCATYSNFPDSAYRQELISYWLDCQRHPGTADPYIDGDFYFDFEVALNHLPMGPTDYLNIELKDSSEWHLLKQFSTDSGSFGWTMQNINITELAKGNYIKIGFIAHGDTGLNIHDWYIDNIKVYRQCNPPRDLHWVAYDEVMSWSPPLPHTPTKDYKGKGLQGYNIYVAYNSQYEFYTFTTDTFHIVDTVGWNGYYVTAIYEDCEPASNPIFGPQSIQELPEDADISVFPNPCNETLNVKSSLPLQSIQIFNTNGEFVLNKDLNNTEIDINTSTFPSGIYFLKTTTSQTSRISKFIVKH